MTTARAFFERQLLPDFAARFGGADRVLNIGAGNHAYREFFSCPVVTSDREPGCDKQFLAESIPYGDESVSGVLMMGVFERLDDPMQAIREIWRVLRRGGYCLLSALDLGFPYHKDCDRWRLSAGGAAHVVRAFTVLASHNVDGLVHFFLLQKPLEVRA